MFLGRVFLDKPSASVVEDVVRNLEWIFKSRRGTSYFLGSFGVSDVGFRTPQEMIVSLSEEIRENVTQFEPRVEILDIDEEWKNGGKRPRLVVKLRIRDASERLELSVDLRTRTFKIVEEKRRAKT